MKKLLKNNLLVVLMLCFVISALLGVGVILQTQSTTALAESVAEDLMDNVAVMETADEVLAEYQFTAINDKECSVRLTNKSEATKAVIPSTAQIDGKSYKVTQVAASGFLSATKLKRVSLPYTIKVVGNMAFANCSSLERISLSNVEELGSNVFYNCKKLERLVLPKSLVKIGATILRNTNVQVLARSDSAGDGWVSNWNTGNDNVQVEYNSTYVEPLVLEKYYNQTARTSVFEGYIVADGQPRTDNFYAEMDEKNIFIPNMYNGDFILGIESFAFEGSYCDQLVVEFSSKVLMLESYAFIGVSCNNITINRDITFVNSTNNTLAENLFSGSTFQTIVLPDSITGIADTMFASCENLTNIYFNKPSYIEKRADMLEIVDKCKDGVAEGVVHLPQNSEFTFIGESAFMGTTGIKELHIYENVKNVGASIFAEWTKEQKAIVHVAEENLPKYDFDTKTGWHQQWSDDLEEENIVFEPEYLTITLNPNGGTVSPTTLRVKRNEAIGNLPVPSLAYHKFVGWFDADGVEYTSETIFKKESNLKLFARWEEFTYTVEYDANRPNFASNPALGAMDSSTVTYSQLFELPTNGYSILGWTFTGWNTRKDGLGNSFTDAQTVSMLSEVNGGTVVLYAQWEVTVYSIEYYPQDIEHKYSHITSYTVESDTLVFEDYVENGYFYSFSLHSINKGSTGKIRITVDKTPQDYNIYYYYNGAPSILDNPTIYNVENIVTFLIPQKDGFDFLGWRIQGTDKFIVSTEGCIGELHLEAVWSTWFYVDADCTTLTVSSDVAEIKLPNCDFVSGCVIVIPSDIAKLKISSIYGITYTMCLQIEQRSTDVEVILDGVTFVALAEHAGIAMESSDATLMLTVCGNVAIYGADGQTSTSNGASGTNGTCAIECDNIVISMLDESQLVICGGNGGDGNKGRDGTSIKKAGNGGNGGDGAYAINATGYIVVKGNGSATLIGGNGGRGGNGGDGIGYDNWGYKGNGGNGSAATNVSVTAEDTDVTLVQGNQGLDGINGSGIIFKED